MIGLAVPIIPIAAASIIADLYPPHQRGRANMVMSICQLSGVAGAFAVGGAVLGQLGSWRETMFWLCIPLPVVLLLLFKLREPERTESETKHHTLKEAWAALIERKKFTVPMLVSGVLVLIADMAAFTWATPTLMRNFAMSPEQVGGVMAATILIGGTSGPLIGGVLSDSCQKRGGPRMTMIMLGILSLLSVPAGLFAIAPGSLPAIILLVLFITMGTAIAVMTMTVTTIAIPSELRGIYLTGSGAIAAFFGAAVAPVSVSILADLLGGTSAIGIALALICSIASLLGAGIFFLGARGLAGETEDIKPRMTVKLI